MPPGENWDVSGEIVPLLRRLQAGDEEAFGRLYAVTNPVLVRYLRVVSDADPAPLALATWATLLPDIAGFVADEDDDWFELAVGTARTHALEAAAFRSDDPTTADPSSDAPAVVVTHPEPDADPVGVGVTMLRACGPAAGEVLAIGALGGLGRDSIARITGREPSEVLALVLDGEARLAQPLTGLMTTMRTPGTPAEVSDLPIVVPLFDAHAHTPLPAPARAASAGTLTVLDLLPWDAPARGPVTAQAMPPRGGAAVVPTRWARIGAGAAAWTFALGGVAAAAAMIEVVPAALHTLFGGSSPVVTAHGPTHQGGAPQGGGLGATPAPPGQQSGSRGPAVPHGGGPSPTGTFQSGGGVAVPVSTPGVVSGTQVVVVSAVFTDTSTSTQSTSTQSTSTQPTSGQSPAGAPSPPSVAPPTPTPLPPTPATGGGGGSGPQAAGQAHVKHSTGNAKGRTKATTASSAQARAKAARARAAAAKAKAAKAAAAKAAKAKAAAHAKAAKFQA